MEEVILDADSLPEGKIKGRIANVILYSCLLIYLVLLLMAYKTVTFDDSTELGDLMFHRARGPGLSLMVLFMTPLGIFTSLISYIRLEKGHISDKTIFLLISPVLQFFIYLIIIFFL
jgi:hypothetical protein